MADCADKPNFSLKSINSIIRTWPISKRFSIIWNHFSKFLFHQIHNLFLWHSCKRTSISNRHHFNKTYMNRIFTCKLCYPTKILFFQSQWNTIDLQLDIRIFHCFFDSIECSIQKIPSGNFAETFSVQSIKADVQTVQPGFCECLHLSFQKDSICRQCDLLNP